MGVPAARFGARLGGWGRACVRRCGRRRASSTAVVHYRRRPAPRESSRLITCRSKVEDRGEEGAALSGSSFWTLISEEFDLEKKATLVELPVFFGTDKPEQFFDFDRWKLHKSRTRYASLLLGILFGITTKRILITVALLTAFSGGVGLYNAAAAVNPDWPELALPLTPFELTVPVLGLLLVFRTNSAYERFDSGNRYAWEVTGQVRNIIRQLVVYGTDPLTPPTETTTAWQLVDAFCVLHSWLMTSYLKGAPNSGQQAAVLRSLLGDREGTGRRKLRDLQSSELSFWALSAAISLALARRLPSMRPENKLAIESELSNLTMSLGACEQLLRTPIPLGYTRYSVRFLWLWLTLLPFALYKAFDQFGADTWWADKPQPTLAFAMLFVGFIFLSIEDIAVQIEEPFAVLPLRQHQKWLMEDVRQMQAVVTVFAREDFDSAPAAGADDGEDEEEEQAAAVANERGSVQFFGSLAAKRQRQAEKWLRSTQRRRTR